MNRWPKSRSTKKCFGTIGWEAVREAASLFLPKHTAAAAWNHRNLSHVEQEGLPPMAHDREQGDVDGPLECSLALVMVAAEAARSRGCSAGVTQPSVDWC